VFAQFEQSGRNNTGGFFLTFSDVIGKKELEKRKVSVFRPVLCAT